MNTTLQSWVRSVALAASATAVALAMLIIAAEELPALKNWLKATFSHHWLGKGALALLFFAALAVILRQREPGNLARVIALEAVFAALSVLAIAGFFLLHLLGAV